MLKGTKKKNLTATECLNIVQHLLLVTKAPGQHKKRQAAMVAKKFGCSKDTVRRIWRRAAVDLTGAKIVFQDVALRKKGRSGRKPKHTAADAQARIITVPQARRFCFRSLAHAIKMPQSTLHYYYKRGVIAKYSSYLKPILTSSNKVARLKWALDRVKEVQGTKYFNYMYDTVHVDEKWFFMTRKKKVIYDVPG
ncbi:Aste57867_4587 [Aphanomyces stellatus]|uniref:Aste57867_4587 protein n=1 Tax=Aphanomyces stellatus TaxID=120398 RepID=A0A485KCW7_9STRA|nr:hypothetical protein As57867_004574 [Aphanomyces stellatus]VFT81692.1 Aste57867_4587 [Aphanomyces stellatus]